MNCAQCGTRVKALTEGMHLDEAGEDWMFCNRDCLRAWLGPDRPLTRRVEQWKNDDLLPQHIAVFAFDNPRRAGESYTDYVKRLEECAQCAANQLR